MPTITIDDEVFSYLQKHARPFVDTPNSTLRRLLSIGTTAEAPEAPSESGLEDLIRDAGIAHGSRRAPKADLEALVKAGLLNDGERLHLVDYQEKRIGPYEATVSGALLEFGGRHYTMSRLAQKLLKTAGFTSNAVRGPAHWSTSNNVTVKDLWRQLSAKQPNARAG